MERIAGLKEYVAWKQYRSALGLPDQVTEEYRMLAQGEYNRNYLFTHPVTGRKLVLRVNCGSQMHLEHQIQYEYETLKLLWQSGRTPRPFYADGSLEKIPHGIMVMEFLPGHAMDYRTELSFGAECLADIHSVRVGSGSHLVRPEDPLEAILTECEAMVRTYMDSDLGDQGIKMKIRQCWTGAGSAAGKQQPAKAMNAASTRSLIPPIFSSTERKRETTWWTGRSLSMGNLPRIWAIFLRQPPPSGKQM